MGKLCGDGESVAFVATDTDERWTVVRTTTGFSWAHEAGSRAVRADVTVSGPVRDLYLLAWKRIRPDDAGLKVRGDADGFEHWFRHSSV
jgi:predicted lipid carrier protein YhbT